MCLALPARVVSIDEDGSFANVAVGGVVKEVSLALVDRVSVGEYLLIHVGYALHKLSIEEAEKTLALFAEAGVVEEGQ
jgi:hydrogenase expression/formation protein HypC